MSTNRRIEDELDDRWRNKGGSHIKDKSYVPKVCPVCKGNGTVWNISQDTFIECTQCLGIGEIG